MPDPIHQFEIHELYPLKWFFGSNASFTNASLHMVLAALGLAGFLYFATRGRALVPGRMTGGMIDELERDLQRVTGKSTEELKEDRTKGLPMGRRVEPSEVAAAAVWLASAEAAYVTAERFNFSGGMELA